MERQKTCTIKTIGDFLESLQSKKVIFWLEDEKIKYKAPSGTITKADLNVIKENKELVFQYLKQCMPSTEEAEQAFPLTSIQNAYLLGSDDAYELGGINAHYYMELECKEIQHEQLNEAFNEVIRHTEALRTVVLAGGLQTVLYNVPEYQIEEFDFEKEEERISMRQKWSHCKFDYRRWPLFHMRLSKIKGQKSRIHFDFDCIIMDAWSAKMMVTKIFEVYHKKEVKWPKYTFRQYCFDEIEYKKSNPDTKALEYWKKVAPKLPNGPALPYKKELACIQNHRFERLTEKLTKEETAKLYQIFKEKRVTPAAVICTIYMKTLAQHSEHSEFALNLTLFNRMTLHEDIQDVLGDFTNIGVAKFKGGNADIWENVKFVQKQFWNLVRFHAFDGTQILKIAAPVNYGKAVFPVVFTGVLQGDRKRKRFIPEDVEEGYAVSQTPQVVLDYQATDFNGELLMNWDYVTEAFEQELIQEMFQENVMRVRKLLNGQPDV